MLLLLLLLLMMMMKKKPYSWREYPGTAGTIILNLPITPSSL